MKKWAYKPHLKLVGGVWRCSTWKDTGKIHLIITGCGSSIVEAYEDWRTKWIT